MIQALKIQQKLPAEIAEAIDFPAPVGAITTPSSFCPNPPLLILSIRGHPLEIGFLNFGLNLSSKSLFQSYPSSRRTPGVTGTPRIWISAHVGYICIIRTAYARTTTYIIYYYYLHRYRDGTYRDPHTTRCGTGNVCCKIVHRCHHHRSTYLLHINYLINTLQ